MPTITRETRKRGLFGWLFLVAFWLWNAFMAAWMFLGLGSSVDHYQAAGQYRNASAVGSAIGMTFVLTLWLIGALVIGLMVMFTRGQKILITTET